MNLTEYLISCLGEEAIETAMDLAKLTSKANRFGIHDVNVLEPDGPTNQERVVDELNDLLAVIELLVELRAIPADWISREKMDAKRDKLVKFIEYAAEAGTLHYDHRPMSATENQDAGVEAIPPTVPRARKPLNMIDDREKGFRTYDHVQTRRVFRPALRGMIIGFEEKPVRALMVHRVVGTSEPFAVVGVTLENLVQVVPHDTRETLEIQDWCHRREVTIDHEGYRPYPPGYVHP